MLTVIPKLVLVFSVSFLETCSSRYLLVVRQAGQLRGEKHLMLPPSRIPHHSLRFSTCRCVVPLSTVRVRPAARNARLCGRASLRCRGGRERQSNGKPRRATCHASFPRVLRLE